MCEFPWRIAGAARFSGARCESANRGFVLASDSLPDMLEQVCSLPGAPSASLENFRRGNGLVKQYLIAALLVSADAGVPPDENAAVLDFSREGSHRQNLAYFEDYKAFGRQLGRGHLFVGTLPSTPACEAAIALHLHGAVYYLNALGRFAAFREETGLLLTEYPAVLAFHRKDGVLHAFLMVPGATRFDSDDPGPDSLFAGGTRR